MMRLDKFLADCGAASRREAAQLIRQGRVSVDGMVVRSADLKIDESRQTVCLNGTALSYSKFHYYMMNKPAGVLSATRDADQKTVLELLPEPERKMGLFPIGRLDKDTTGLLILTDDGALSHRVTSPKSLVPKCYAAKVDGILGEEDISAFAAGIVLGDGTSCLPAVLEPDSQDPSLCKVTVCEGKYHQVKRMLASVGKPVISLHRVSIGALFLDESLAPGAIRNLSPEEVNRMLLREY